MGINVKHVFEGWKKVLFKDGESRQLATERYDKGCISCDHNVFSPAMRYVAKGTEFKFDSRKCSKCQCPLIAKLQVQEENCPLNKW